MSICRRLIKIRYFALILIYRKKIVINSYAAVILFASNDYKQNLGFLVTFFYKVILSQIWVIYLNNRLISRFVGKTTPLRVFISDTFKLKGFIKRFKSKTKQLYPNESRSKTKESPFL